MQAGGDDPDKGHFTVNHLTTVSGNSTHGLKQALLTFGAE